MRVTLTHLVLIAAAASAACKDDRNEIVAPREGGSNLVTEVKEGKRPIVRITSPLNAEAVAGGEGVVGTGSLTAGAGFGIVIETVTGDRTDVPAVESTNIRNTALLGQANPNFPGLTVTIDEDLITPDGTIIPANTNLANLFNTLGTDDSPGAGVTTWVGWHVLESFSADVQKFKIRASVVNAAGQVGTDEVEVKVDQSRASGQALTPAPTAVGGDGVDDADGPEVTLVGPRDPSSVAAGTPTGPSFAFLQVQAIDRTGAGIGVNENGAGITNPVGLIRDPAQLAVAGANRNFPGLVFTFDVPFRRGNGVVVPAGQNLGPLFDLAGSALDRSDLGRVVTNATWVVGGSFLLPAGQTSVTMTARVTDNAGKTGSATRTFAISPVAEGQALTPAP